MIITPNEINYISLGVGCLKQQCFICEYNTLYHNVIKYISTLYYIMCFFQMFIDIASVHVSIVYGTLVIADKLVALF